ncbi:helix-turn-helix domain-containing protein, partial [Gracilibacillus thailandensis]|uniref:helix-turn-helix domain-containing protein n=1 Tax=Gracilibacillus thailandensis TaxID=563735 RepID=UPI003627F398
MAKQNKAYKFRIYPTAEQVLMIRKTFGCVRFIYNKMLAERKETYESLKDDKEALKKIKHPTPAKYKKEFEWLNTTNVVNGNIQLLDGHIKLPKLK